MPSTWLPAKAVITNPMTRPRASRGKRSATIAMLIDPMTPPKRPVTARAPSSNRVRRREAAEQRADDEARVEEEEELLAVEPVGEAGREQARDRRAESVRRHDEPELRRDDGEVAHEHRPEGRQDHEVEDDGELEEGQDRDDGDLVARELHGGGGSSHGRCSDARSKPPVPPRTAGYDGKPIKLRR